MAEPKQQLPTPPLRDDGLPALPPGFPGLSLPGLPNVNLPGLPNVNLPGLSDINLPALPA